MNPIEEQRLRKLWENANAEEVRTGTEFAEAQVHVSDGRQAYFDRLALLDGGTITLVVTFIASKTGRALEPRVLLHSAIAALLFGMLFAVARNWAYHEYYYLATMIPWRQAQKDAQAAKFNYMRASVMPLSIHTGQPLDKQEALTGFQESDEGLAKWLVEHCGKRDRSERRYQFFEQACHATTIVGMTALALVAILNF